METLIIGGHFDGRLTTETDNVFVLKYIIKSESPEFIEAEAKLEKVDQSFGTQIYVRDIFRGSGKDFVFYRARDLTPDKVIELLFNKYKEKL